MSDAHDKFSQILNQLIDEKMFSMEAFDRIKTLKDEHQRLTQRCDSLAHEVVRKENDLTNAKIQLNESTVELQKFQKREKELVERENKMTRLEIEKECSDKMVAHTTGLFNTVFRNVIVHETVMRDVMTPVTGNPGGNGSYSTPGLFKKIER